MRKWMAPLLLLGGGILISLLLTEIILRMVGYSHPVFHQVDEFRGMALRPGTEGWFREEGEAYIQINSAGFRDREHSIQKDKDTFRIAVLGDSYAEALQVPVENTFWSVLAQELKSCQAMGSRNPEILNFGVSGYGTGQELITWRRIASQYSPDLVVLAFLTGNDVRNNSKPLNKVDYIPYFAIQNGEIVLDKSYLQSPGYRSRGSRFARFFLWMTDHFRTVQLLNHARQTLRVSLRAKQHNNEKTENNIAELGLDDKVYAPPQDEEWQNAWTLTEALLESLNREVRKKDARFLVTTLSNGVQVHPDPAKRNPLKEKLQVDHLFYPDYRIKALGDKSGFDVLNLAPTFQKRATTQGTFFHGFGEHIGSGHWNSDGHQQAGVLISRHICEHLK